MQAHMYVLEHTHTQLVGKQHQPAAQHNTTQHTLWVHEEILMRCLQFFTSCLLISFSDFVIKKKKAFMLVLTQRKHF